MQTIGYLHRGGTMSGGDNVLRKIGGGDNVQGGQCPGGQCPGGTMSVPRRVHMSRPLVFPVRSGIGYVLKGPRSDVTWVGGVDCC